MDSKNCHKRILYTQNAKEDRISNLPDEVLSLILSLLPTKCAVGTSVLSNRWRYLWTSITSLNFIGPTKTCDNDSALEDFINFVDHVFRTRSSSNIQSFSLKFQCGREESDHVTSWINEVIKLNVSQLHVDIYRLPYSIFSCRTLTALTFTNNFVLDPNVVSFNLPHLKVLHIQPGYHLCGFMKKLISSCPVLKELTISGSLRCRTLATFTISSPTLKFLRLKPSRFIWNFHTNNFSVNTPNLQYLHLSTSSLRYSIKGDFSSLIEAIVEIGDGCYIHPEKDYHAGLFLSKFQNLTYLEVITWGNYFRAIPNLLRISPSLKVIHIVQQKKQEADDKLAEEVTWIEPKCVPRCLKFQLEVMKIKGFMGTNHELELLEYFLGNAKALQELAIKCQELTQEEEMRFCGQLLSFSRASRYCKIQFEGNFLSNS